MKGNSKATSIAVIAAVAMLVVVAAVGTYALNGGFDDWSSNDGASSATPDDTLPWSLPGSSSGSTGESGSPNPEGASSSSGGSGGSSGDGGSELPTLPRDDGDDPSSGSGGSDTGSGDSGSSSPPADTNYIYGGPRVNGFYTGTVSVGFGHAPDQGTEVSGSGLRTGTNYAISVDADVTDYGLQWYKDGARPVNSNNDPANPVKEWMAVDTSVAMILEIHSDRAISAEDVSVSSVWGKQLAMGDPSENGPGLRSIEQVDPNTLRAFLVYEPYAASSSAGAFQSPISLASGNGSVENFNDKGALAAYAPLKIHFNTPGNYDLSFYLAKIGTGGSIEYHASPTTTVSVSVAGKA